MPNVNKGIVTLLPSSNTRLVSGAIYGHVSGPAGLPAIGATIVAAEQQTGHTGNSIISIDGNYYFQVPAGKYNVMVAFISCYTQKFHGAFHHSHRRITITAHNAITQ